MVSEIIERIPVCSHGNATLVSGALVTLLKAVEASVGFQLHFNSGYRCPHCNRTAGGVPNSAHLRGMGVDIAAPDSGSRFLILYHALDAGCKRIGIGKNFLHLDVDESLPQNVIWVYT